MVCRVGPATAPRKWKRTLRVYGLRGPCHSLFGTLFILETYFF